MATGEEIRKRVRDADTRRIEQRADAAATVAHSRAEIDRLRAELEEAERQSAANVAEAEKLMTRSELAIFLDVKPGTVAEWAAAGTTRNRRRNGHTRARARKSNKASAHDATDTTPHEATDTAAPTISPADVQ